MIACPMKCGSIMSDAPDAPCLWCGYNAAHYVIGPVPCPMKCGGPADDAPGAPCQKCADDIFSDPMATSPSWFEILCATLDREDPT